MAVTFPAQTVGTAFTAEAPTFSHNSPSGTDTIIVYVNAMGAEAAVTAVTYNVLALTELLNFVGNNNRVQMWYRVAPTTGANNIVVTGGGEGQHAAKTFHGVDQTDPFHNPADTATNTAASGSNPSATITTSADKMAVFACSLTEETATDASFALSPGTEDYDSSDANSEPRGASGHLDSTGSVTPTWSGGADNSEWAMIIADLKEAAAAGGLPVPVAFDHLAMLHH